MAEIFATRGYDVWWDVELLPGQRFADEINAVLSNAKAAIVLWTPKAVKSHWVKSEASIALNRDILVPARLESVELPAPFNTIHTCDLSAWDGSVDDSQLSELLESVAILAGEPTFAGELRSDTDIENALAKPQHEVEFWIAVSNRSPQSISEYQAYLEQYGMEASFASLAQIRMQELLVNKPNAKRISIARSLTLVCATVVTIAVAIQIFNNPHQRNDADLTDSSDANIPRIEKAPATTDIDNVIATEQEQPETRASVDPIKNKGLQTTLLEYPNVILDVRSKLVWAKNIYSVGYTKALFEKSEKGEGSLAHDIKTIRDKASALNLDSVEGWRLATTEDLLTLQRIDPSAVFLAFFTSRPGPMDVIGIYMNDSGNVSPWGYQHANYLSDPIESSWIQGNDLGVWLVSDASDVLDESEGVSVYARPEVHEEKRLVPIITGRLLKNDAHITHSWEDVTEGLVGNLESDDTRTVFEYSLKPIDKGGFVRAEVSLNLIWSSGEGEATISIYRGDGLIKDGDWQPESLLSTSDMDTITWSAKQNSRIELPAHFLRNFYNTGEIVGLHFRYAGKGNIHFKPPSLIITYVKNSNLVTQSLNR